MQSVQSVQSVGERLREQLDEDGLQVDAPREQVHEQRGPRLHHALLRAHSTRAISCNQVQSVAIGATSCNQLQSVYSVQISAIGSNQCNQLGPGCNQRTLSTKYATRSTSLASCRPALGSHSACMERLGASNSSRCAIRSTVACTAAVMSASISSRIDSRSDT
eukprot:822056-Prymnesium_polylepis.1